MLNRKQTKTVYECKNCGKHFNAAIAGRPECPNCKCRGVTLIHIGSPIEIKPVGSEYVVTK